MYSVTAWSILFQSIKLSNSVIFVSFSMPPMFLSYLKKPASKRGIWPKRVCMMEIFFFWLKERKNFFFDGNIFFGWWKGNISFETTDAYSKTQRQSERIWTAFLFCSIIKKTCLMATSYGLVVKGEILDPRGRWFESSSHILDGI